MTMLRRTSSMWALAAIAATMMVIAPVASAGAAEVERLVGTVGGIPKPLAGTDVRLDDMTVQMQAFGQYAWVRADFRLFNEGSAKTVRLGLPFVVPFAPADGEDRAPVVGVHAELDGVRLPLTWQKPPRDGSEFVNVGYFTSDAEVPAGESVLSVDYLAAPNVTVAGTDIPNAPESYAGMWTNAAAYEYWAHTGTGWKGPIRRYILRFSMTPDFTGWGFEWAQRKVSINVKRASQPAAKALLGYRKLVSGVYQWEFKDFEPALEAARPMSPYDLQAAFLQPTFEVADESIASDWPPDWVRSVTASSELDRDGRLYDAESLRLGVSGMWAEGVAGPGVGQWLRFGFGGKRRIREVRVLPGDARSEAAFLANNRPKTLEITFSDGTLATLALKDEPVLQTYAVDVDAVSAKIVVKDVYKGTGTDDTFISMVDFGKAPMAEPVPIDTLLARPDSGIETGGAAVDETTGGLWTPLTIGIAAGCAIVLLLGVVGFVLSRRGREA
jgi:hypothetical protein